MKPVPMIVKCDCGCTRNKHHQGEGQCSTCGCTWFHPNINYIQTLRCRAYVGKTVKYLLDEGEVQRGMVSEVRYKDFTWQFRFHKTWIQEKYIQQPDIFEI